MTILDAVPQPGSVLENAFRAIDAEDRRERQDAAERERQRAASWQDKLDAASTAAMLGHGGPPSHIEILQAASRIGDLEDEREARMKAKASTRSEQLEEQAAQLRAELAKVHGTENARAAGDRARVMSAQRHADRARSEASLRYR